MRSAPFTKTEGRVLVIDDDELAATMLKQTLESDGFSVWSLLSPVGASQLIERLGIQAAVVDVNMPVITGDRLVKLLRSWAPFKHLPIVLVSGMPSAQLAEIARGLPDVSIITKARVAEELVALIRKSIGVAPEPARRAIAHESGGRTTEVTETFLKQLPDQMAQAMVLWERVCLGKLTERTLVRGLLHMLKGQSNLLGYEGLAELFAVILDVLSALPSERLVDPSIEHSVARAFGVVAGLARAPASTIAGFDPGATLEHLTHIRDSLRAP